MRIVVCIKQVPEAGHVRFDDETRRIVRKGVPLVLNAYDRRTILAAVALRQQYGGEVVAMTMGPSQAEEALVECLALGADRARLLNDPAFAGSDTLATARTLARAIRLEPFDLILCGLHSLDAETGQVGPQLAAMLGIPHIAAARSLQFDSTDNVLSVERDTPRGQATVQSPLPALVTGSERLAKGTSPDATAMALARAKPIERLGIFHLGGALTDYGICGSPTEVRGIIAAPGNRQRSVRHAACPEIAAQSLLAFLEAQPIQRRDLPRMRPRPIRPVTGPAIWFLVGDDTTTDSIAGELAASASAIADRIGGHVVAVNLGGEHRDFGPLGADRSISISHHEIGRLRAEPATAALVAAIASFTPWTILASTGFIGREVLPRAAATLGLGLTADCVGLGIDRSGREVFHKPAYGGMVVAPIRCRTEPRLATLRPGIVPPLPISPGRQASVDRFYPPSVAPGSVQVVAEQTSDEADSTALEQAHTIIGVGAGIGSPAKLDLVRELAELLDARVAGTRKVVNWGWLPASAQIGLTGRAVAPQRYLALGIRGGYNHVVGVRRAAAIAAINRDPAAPIFQAVDYGVVGDWEPMVRALIAELAARKPAVAVG